MTTNKTQANAAQSIQAANELACTGFPAAKVKAALVTLESGQTNENIAKNGKANTALELCVLAGDFVLANADVDTETVEKAWKQEVLNTGRELAVKGSQFFEVKESKKAEGESRIVMKGYGRNVISIATGLIHFGVAADFEAPKVQKHVPEEGTGEVTFGILRKAVQAMRAEERRDADPDAAAFEDAMALLDEAWTELRAKVKASNDLPIVEELTESLMALVASQASAESVQDELEDATLAA